MTVAVTLPATLEKSVEGDYSVRHYSPRPGRVCNAFSASIYREDELIGFVKNDGSQAAHVFSFVNDAEHELWNEYVSAHDWDIEMGDFDVPLTDDTVFDLLAEETLMSGYLNRTALERHGIVATQNETTLKEGTILVALNYESIPAGFLYWRDNQWQVK